MISRWTHLKSKAVVMRKRGASVRDIEKRLGIPRSTLSGWFKDIPLSDHHREKLQQKWKGALETAREKARLWHSEQKTARLITAEKQAADTLARIVDNDDALELALAMLYLGEGTKSQKGLVLGNSNPDILKFFIGALQLLYKIDFKRIRCELHLRADQKPKKETGYWSRILYIPKEQFKAAYIDQRTLGKKTYKSYHGVCVVSYGDVAIQRKLMYLYNLYCLKVIQRGG